LVGSTAVDHRRRRRQRRLVPRDYRSHNDSGGSGGGGGGSRHLGPAPFLARFKTWFTFPSIMIRLKISNSI